MRSTRSHSGASPRVGRQLASLRISSRNERAKAASTAELVQRCYPAFRKLRPHLDEETFLQRWKDQAATGYQIVFVEADGEVVAAAGFRELSTMADGRILYLDDLVALPAHRGAGYGATLLGYIQAETVRRGLAELHLDTG